MSGIWFLPNEAERREMAVRMGLGTWPRAWGCVCLSSHSAVTRGVMSRINCRCCWRLLLDCFALSTQLRCFFTFLSFLFCLSKLNISFIQLYSQEIPHFWFHHKFAGPLFKLFLNPTWFFLNTPSYLLSKSPFF